MIFLYCFLGVFIFFLAFAMCAFRVSKEADEMERRMWREMMAEKRTHDESDDCVERQEE